MSTAGAAAKKSKIYEKIASRLARLDVKISDYIIESSLWAGSNTLQGISFTPQVNPKVKPTTVLDALKQAKDPAGQAAFAVGSKVDPSHWALQQSFRETEGIGFREIWRPRLTNRPLRWSEGQPGLNVPGLDAGFSAHFGDDPTLPDFSSLHCAVTDKVCKIHVDEMGFVMEVNGQIVVDPDFLRHWAVELLWKTKMKGEVPDWFVDHFSLIIPSSPNKYSRVGVSFDLVQSEKVKLSLTGSCGFKGGFSVSGTVNATGTFDLFGG